jgi:phage FluMu protein Com
MSSDLITIYCKHCGSKLRAKPSLLGQTRNCPKCKSAVLIELGTEQYVPATLHEGITLTPQTPHPVSLHFRNKYFILSRDRLVAVWESGKGWQVNVGNGFSIVQKNLTAIPDNGTFQFVELIISSSDENASFGTPTAYDVFLISQRGALNSLFGSADEILGKISVPSTLSTFQKDLLLNYLRKIFMGETYDAARNVIMNDG